MQSISDLIVKVNQVIVNPIIRFLFVLATAVFLWGVFQYIADSNNPEARKNGAQHMMWGIVGMFIMIGVFGIMRLIANTIGADTTGIP